MDKELFSLLETVDVENIHKKMGDIIYQCCSIKKNVVEIDEFDNGLRLILNFTH